MDSAVDVLCEAFYHYPVMRFILGHREPYADRLRTLIQFFLAARQLRDEPILGIQSKDGSLAGVALVSLPGEREIPPALLERRAATWAGLGEEEQGRYEAYGAAHGQFRIDSPHHHLNMIGVRRSQAGAGLGRALLESVFMLALADPGSSGVSLDTETSENMRLYEHCGYRRIGHARVSDGLTTWVMYRAK
jgi:GNAT superfamily N-acetyltransferase